MESSSEPSRALGRVGALSALLLAAGSVEAREPIVVDEIVMTRSAFDTVGVTGNEEVVDLGSNMRNPLKTPNGNLVVCGEHGGKPWKNGAKGIRGRREVASELRALERFAQAAFVVEECPIPNNNDDGGTNDDPTFTTYQAHAHASYAAVIWPGRLVPKAQPSQVRRAFDRTLACVEAFPPSTPIDCDDAHVGEGKFSTSIPWSNHNIKVTNLQ